MRIMGLDFGSRTTGVAVSDPLGITAQGVETIVRKDENKLRQTCARIEALIKEYEIEEIVLGYPKNMNNTAGERAEKTEAFKAMLERRTGKPVILWDERLTTIAAERRPQGEQKGSGGQDRRRFDSAGISGFAKRLEDN